METNMRNNKNAIILAHKTLKSKLTINKILKKYFIKEAQTGQYRLYLTTIITESEIKLRKNRKQTILEITDKW